MNARLNALATVLDVLVLVGLGLGLFFAPLTLVWAFDDGFSTDLLLSWAIAVDGWMLGHGVPLTFTLDETLAQSLSLGAANSVFVVDVALLGVGLLSVLWGYRIGRRSGTRILPGVHLVLGGRDPRCGQLRHGFLPPRARGHDEHPRRHCATRAVSGLRTCACDLGGVARPRRSSPSRARSQRVFSPYFALE